MDNDLFREAMARLGAAVNVITANGPEGACGFTASAVCSVTDNPPTLLVCMNRGNRSSAAFALGTGLCVNTLAGDQAAISQAFAAPLSMEEKFASGQWSRLKTGAPALEGAAVAFDCRIVQIAEIGTHNVLFCSVEDIALGKRSHGLIYLGRRYHRIAHGPEE